VLRSVEKLAHCGGELGGPLLVHHVTDVDGGHLGAW